MYELFGYEGIMPHAVPQKNGGDNKTMDVIQKFQELLKKLFQFEVSDLDFGIYRVLNYKRDQIEKFIQEDLKNKVEDAFAKHKDERLTDINQRFESAKEKVNQNLGPTAFTPTGDLKEEFKDTPVGKDFLLVKAQKEEAEAIDEIKLQVFNDLYNFFSRYYEEGDFVPHYRYSIKGHKYAIPYNGEEVKLYWVNSEQYYTKTGVLFRDYTFRANDYKVIFRIVSAKEELASNKATRERFFVLDDEQPLTIENKALIIRFQYRELTEDEVKDYEVVGGSNAAKQEKINQRSYDEVLKRAKDPTLGGFLGKEYKNGNPLLLYHISRFSAKNTKDYFIHKNLKKFLSEQLDYFIKAEVLDIETLEKERFLDKHTTRAKVVREIGEDIIDFLSQIEDFQKRLWEKKKFVLKTEYVITTDRVPEEFYEEIWANKLQRKEWGDLGFEIPKTKEQLRDTKLPIDTKYFTLEFKEKLLEKLTENADLDDLLDGVLIKSENWQALNTILSRFKEKVQTIYIDPPFNKEQDADYLYNVKYKDSTWMSMLENRLRLARELLNEKGSIFVRCDYNGDWLVRPLMNDIFGEENFRNEIVINRKRQAIGTPNKFEVENELLFLFSKGEKFLKRDIFRPRSLVDMKWTSFLKQEERRPPERVFLGKTLYPPKGQHFALVQKKVDKLLKEHYLRLKCRSCTAIYYWDKEDSRELFSKKLRSFKDKFKYFDISADSKVWGVTLLDRCLNCGADDWQVEYLTSEEIKIGDNWKDIVSYDNRWGFKTENSEILLQRVIESTSNEGDLVMDFFLGSGTTTAVAHKLGRKWIGVEMGEHFWTVVLPRMKKVLAYDKSGISKERNVKEKYNKNTAGGFFKYQVIEQYEDALDNIELKENQKARELFKDQYLLKYFLDYETRESSYFLNIDQLKNPFAYQLKVNLEELGEPEEIIVDIPETFNYLLGLKVKKVKARNNGGKYWLVLGEKEQKEIAVVWREYNDNWTDEDWERDREFIIKEIEPWAPHIVYVNGQSVLTPKIGNHAAAIRYIEPEFKNLMEQKQ